MNNFPNPSHYNIRLDTELRDVTSLTLTHVSIPYSMYTVNVRNDTLSIIFPEINNYTTLFAYIDHGIYHNGSELSIVLEKALRAITSDVKFCVTYNSITDKLNVWSSHKFIILFASSQLTARLLGFEPINMSSIIISSTVMVAPDPDMVYVLESLYRIDLWVINRYMSIHIWHPVIDNIISDVPSINSALAIIPIYRRYTQFNSNFTHSINVNNSELGYAKIIWNPPLASFAKIGVTLKDEDGNLVDFHNQDHYIEFIVETLPNAATLRYS